jgi:hypothetical protein
MCPSQTLPCLMHSERALGTSTKMWPGLCFPNKAMFAPSQQNAPVYFTALLVTTCLSIGIGNVLDDTIVTGRDKSHAASKGLAKSRNA